MDAERFLCSITDRAKLLSRATHMLFAQCGMVDDVPCITFGFIDEPKKHTERFMSIGERGEWWKEFITIMTEHCMPPCITKSTVLFQPVFLRQFLCYANAHMHYVILDFGNDRSVWLGCHNKERQISLYTELIKDLDAYLEPEQPSPFSKHFIPPI